MEIQGVATTDSIAQQVEEEKSTLDVAEDTKNQFLELLVTQLQNQDPFAPADSAQFTQQMMMMGQLEQLVNLNTNVASMATAQQGALISQYTSIVGKKVETAGNQFEITEDGDNGLFKFTLPETPLSTEINVFDQFGNLVRDFDPIVQTSGTHEVGFDGKDAAGNPLKPGYYTYTVSALNRDSNGMLPTTYSTGRISSIRLENGTPIFQMGEQDVGIVEIQKIF